MDQSPGNFPSPFQFRNSTRGMTLVELMIVVAIVGILAAIAIVSYSSYIEEGRMTELRSYTMDIKRGQEQFFSRNHEYFQPANNEYDSSADDDEWTQLLEFNKNVPVDTIIGVEAGIGGNCGICDDVDPTALHNEDQAWFAVRAHDSALDRSVIMTSDHDNPIEVDGAWGGP